MGDTPLGEHHRPRNRQQWGSSEDLGFANSISAGPIGDNNVFVIRTQGDLDVGGPVSGPGKDRAFIFPTEPPFPACRDTIQLFPPGPLGGLWKAVIDDILETGTISLGVESVQQMHADDAAVHARHEQMHGVPLLHALMQLRLLHPQLMVNDHDTEEHQRERKRIFLPRRSSSRNVISILIAAGAKTEGSFQRGPTDRGDYFTRGVHRHVRQAVEFMFYDLSMNEDRLGNVHEVG
ncbi:hypothetical protein FN846DRAFT_902416 [Sphaerosporella brunnea]|uniref:Uncharacterized protein n=1 Tax=Sphaerosporella brunnea TaxID=1250544 RepID=A0A5J5FAA7_9PEZI|nr:hypothetical protein FN846DRAFT_902416 [Sphaerosporella brunnea]